jgi:hypothetical protein
VTTLTRPLRREVQLRGIARPVIITLDDGLKAITFREKGCHVEFSLPMLTAYANAVLVSERKEK